MPSDDSKLEPWTDPALEARLVAMILGEASDYERAELEGAIADNPDLQSLHSHLSTAHQLLLSSHPVESSDADAPEGWKLSPERRTVVLERIAEGTATSEDTPPTPNARTASGEPGQWRRLAAVAAVLAIACALTLTLSFPIRSKLAADMAGHSEQRIIQGVANTGGGRGAASEHWETDRAKIRLNSKSTGLTRAPRPSSPQPGEPSASEFPELEWAGAGRGKSLDSTRVVILSDGSGSMSETTRGRRPATGAGARLSTEPADSPGAGGARSETRSIAASRNGGQEPLLNVESKDDGQAPASRGPTTFDLALAGFGDERYDDASLSLNKNTRWGIDGDPAGVNRYEYNSYFGALEGAGEQQPSVRDDDGDRGKVPAPKTTPGNAAPAKLHDVDKRTKEVSGASIDPPEDERREEWKSDLPGLDSETLAGDLLPDGKLGTAFNRSHLAKEKSEASARSRERGEGDARDSGWFTPPAVDPIPSPDPETLERANGLGWENPVATPAQGRTTGTGPQFETSKSDEGLEDTEKQLALALDQKQSGATDRTIRKKGESLQHRYWEFAPTDTRTTLRRQNGDGLGDGDGAETPSIRTVVGEDVAPRWLLDGLDEDEGGGGFGGGGNGQGQQNRTAALPGDKLEELEESDEKESYRPAGDNENAAGNGKLGSIQVSGGTIANETGLPTDADLDGLLREGEPYASRSGREEHVERLSETVAGSREREGKKDAAPEEVPIVTKGGEAPGDEERKRLSKRAAQAAIDLEKLAADEPFSTFSLNVSDVSFKLAKSALLEDGRWPEAARVRPEEFVNAFDYRDPSPTLEERVACTVEQCAHPFLQQRNLLRISMETAAAGRAPSQPLRLTVLLDKSGSMERADRERSVVEAFGALAAQLGEGDLVTVVGFARTPRLIADRLPGARAAELAKVVADAPSEGGTNLEEALRFAGESAARQFLDGAQNRIVLITDGAANLGDAEPESLQQRVVDLRERGIAFDACGVGADGLNDEILEALARKGDGRYYFLDRPEDADAGFARQLAGALRPAARNVKVQVEFNPERVRRYRLSGFEKHRLQKEDFRDDKVDAAEMAAAEAGNALYQIEVDPEGQGDIGKVAVRFQDTATGEMVESSWPIAYRPATPRLSEATPPMLLAAAAGLLAEKLKGGPVGDAIDLAELAPLGTALRNGPFGSEARVRDLVEMIQQARALQN